MHVRIDVSHLGDMVNDALPIVEKGVIGSLPIAQDAQQRVNGKAGMDQARYQLFRDSMVV